MITGDQVTAGRVMVPLIISFSFPFLFFVLKSTRTDTKSLLKNKFVSAVFVLKSQIK